MVQDSPEAAGAELARALAAIGSNRVFDKGQSLFREGEPAKGVFLIQQGRVSVLVAKTESALNAVQPARAGAVLGLSECVSGCRFRASAVAAEQTTVCYIQRHELLKFLRQHCEVCMRIVRLLSEDLHVLYHELRHLTPSARHGKRKVLGRVN